MPVPDVYKRQDVSSTHVSQLISEAFKYSHIVLASVSIGAIIYYIVIQLVLTLGFDANLLKLLSASVVAVFLACLLYTSFWNIVS